MSRETTRATPGETRQAACAYVDACDTVQGVTEHCSRCDELTALLEARDASHAAREKTADDIAAKWHDNAVTIQGERNELRKKLAEETQARSDDFFRLAAKVDAAAAREATLREALEKLRDHLGYVIMNSTFCGRVIDWVTVNGIASRALAAPGTPPENKST